MNSIHKFKDILEKEIDMVASKGTISPSELEKMEKAFCILEKISIIEAMDKYGYDSYEMNGASYRRGRSPMTGRYVSRDMYPDWNMNNEPYDNGYSGHSVEDRMIMNLERMLDNANSQYEREAIEKQIREIRNKK